MAIFDILAIVVLALSALFGLIKGFVHQLIKAIGLAGAIYIIYRWGGDVAGFLSDNLGIPSYTASYLTIPAILFGAFIVVSIPAYLLRRALKRTRFGPADRILGLVFGAAKGVVLCAGLFFILVQMPNENKAIRKVFVRHRVFYDSLASEKLASLLKRISSQLPSDFFDNAEKLRKEAPGEAFLYFHETFWAEYAAQENDEARQRFLDAHRGIAFHAEMRVDAVVDENNRILLIDNFLFERPPGPGDSEPVRFRVRLEVSYRPEPGEEAFHSGETLFVSGRIRDFEVTHNQDIQYTILADTDEVNRVK